MTLLSPDEIAPVKRDLDRTLAALDSMLLGRPALHRLVIAGILARGHILLEGLPGLGKTALVTALAKILELDAKRIQFTPDLMPSDIVGSHILETRPDGSREMAFKPGPVFCNLLLADAINRAAPKTQSALLGTMQERSVTLMGVTRQLPDPFFVLASQNPIELEGTYPLPEAQTDRFLFRLRVGSPDAATLTAIISSRSQGKMPDPNFSLSKDALARFRPAFLAFPSLGRHLRGRRRLVDRTTRRRDARRGARQVRRIATRGDRACGVGARLCAP